MEDNERFRRFVNTNYWQFAKTYAAFCPHEYTMKKWDKTGDFDWFVKYVFKNGFLGHYGKMVSRYYIDEETGKYYFVPIVEIDENGDLMPTMLWINRGDLKDFEYVEDKGFPDAPIVWRRIKNNNNKAR